jgi:hypothetical protein
LSSLCTEIADREVAYYTVDVVLDVGIAPVGEISGVKVGLRGGILNPLYNRLELNRLNAMDEARCANRYNEGVCSNGYCGG